jgi:uncharacterized protein (TIGR00369 family)
LSLKTLPDTAFGILDRSQTADLTGLEAMQGMLAGRLPIPPMNRTLDFTLVEVAEGIAVFEGVPSVDLLNPMGTVHGGWALTLIDSACGCAAFTLLPAGVGYTSVETKANFTRAIMADSGPVRCAGRVLSSGRQIITTDATLTGADGRLLGHGTSTIMILPPR